MFLAVMVLMLTWVVNVFFTSYFVSPNRVTTALSSSYSVFSMFVNAQSLGHICGSLLLVLAIINLAGNVPGVAIPSLYYYFTCSVSLTLWVSLIVVIFMTQARDFVAHMLPYGSPSALILFLPLVEVFRQIIRPFTLIVRLRTNLSSGHIMLYIFSFFSLSSFTLTVILFVVLGALLMLELFISLLQAYIFTSLMYLYISEGLPQE